MRGWNSGSNSDLHVVISVEGLVADGAREENGPHEDLSRRGDPESVLRRRMMSPRHLPSDLYLVTDQRFGLSVGIFRQTGQSDVQVHLSKALPFLRRLFSHHTHTQWGKALVCEMGSRGSRGREGAEGRGGGGVGGGEGLWFEPLDEGRMSWGEAHTADHRELPYAHLLSTCLFP